MKGVLLGVLLCLIILNYSVCFSQSTLTVKVVDQEEVPLEAAMVTITWLGGDPWSQETVSNGCARFDTGRIGAGVDIEITAGHKDCCRTRPFRRTTRSHDDTLTIEMKCPCHSCRFINPIDYVKSSRWIGVGLAFGSEMSGGDTLAVSHVPSSARTMFPHPDDLANRYGCIMPPGELDNYVIHDDVVKIDLQHRMSMDLLITIKGILNIALRTSAVEGSQEEEGVNYFTKDYIRPECYGKAYIYYLVRPKKRQLFGRGSFSLPVYLTVPVYDCRKVNRLLFGLLAGTNFIYPERTVLESVRGWLRFDSRQEYRTEESGEIKSVQWFAGLYASWTRGKIFELALQAVWDRTGLEENSEALHLDKEHLSHLSLRVNAKLSPWK